MRNRSLHIRSNFETLRETDINDIKLDIAYKKVDIGKIKADIARVFHTKTASHIKKLLETFETTRIFGRSDVMRVTGLKSSRASALLNDMLQHQLIQKVSGYGKGKYKFKSGR